MTLSNQVTNTQGVVLQKGGDANPEIQEYKYITHTNTKYCKTQIPNVKGRGLAQKTERQVQVLLSNRHQMCPMWLAGPGLTEIFSL